MALVRSDPSTSWERVCLLRWIIATVAALWMAPPVISSGRVLLLYVLDEPASVPASALTVVSVLMALITSFASAYGNRAGWSRAQRQGVGLVTALALAGGVVVTTQSNPDVIIIAFLLSTASLVLTSSIPTLVARLPEELDLTLVRHWAARLAWSLVTIAVVYAGATLSASMTDARRTGASLFSSGDAVAHHCKHERTGGFGLSVLAESSVDGVCHTQPVLGVDPRATAEPHPIVDAEHPVMELASPPSFPTLVREPRDASRGSSVLRALWFALGMVFVSGGLLALAIWIGGRAGATSALLAPMVWGAPPTLAALQSGQADVVLVIAVVLAMVAFEQGHRLVGASVLALTSWIDPLPGLVLLLYLGLRGRRREALLTLLMVGLTSAIVWWLLGPELFALVNPLPDLSSTKNISLSSVHMGDVAANSSWFGLPAKLEALGLMSASWSTARVLGLLYGVALTGLTVVVARQAPERSTLACGWLALASLAALWGPFAPSHVTVGAMALLAIRASEVRSAKGGVLLATVWIGLSWIPTMTQWIGNVVASLVHQIQHYAVLVWVVVRGRRRSRDETSSSDGPTLSDTARSYRSPPRRANPHRRGSGRRR